MVTEAGRQAPFWVKASWHHGFTELSVRLLVVFYVNFAFVANLMIFHCVLGKKIPFITCVGNFGPLI